MTRLLQVLACIALVLFIAEHLPRALLVTTGVATLIGNLSGPPLKPLTNRERVDAENQRQQQCTRYGYTC